MLMMINFISTEMENSQDRNIQNTFPNIDMHWLDVT